MNSNPTGSSSHPDKAVLNPVPLDHMLADLSLDNQESLQDATVATLLPLESPQPIIQDELAEFRERWQQEIAISKSVTSSSVASMAAESGTHSGTASPPPAIAVSRSTRSRQASVDTEVASKSELEPSRSVKPAPIENALSIYERATQHERMGNLNSALNDYRKALRLDPNVEQKYRVSLKSNSQKSSSVPLHQPNEDHRSTYYTYYHFPEDSEELSKAKVIASKLDQLALQYRQEEVEFIPKNPCETNNSTHRFKDMLFYLPTEVVSNCVKWAVLRDAAMIQTLAIVCKKFFIMTRERSLYHFLCQRIHCPNPIKFYTSLAQEVHEYHGDWLTMFLEKPRLRFNGVYISRVNYLRTGYGESWSQPVHVVTYFRYLRFFADTQTVIMYTTTAEPSQTVKLLQNASFHATGTMKGQFVFDYQDRVLLDMQDPERPNCRFTCNLSVAHTKRAKNTRLDWIDYTVQTSKSTSQIPLQTLRPFIFSKVKSFI